jgi:hypothetical protein
MPSDASPVLAAVSAELRQLERAAGLAGELDPDDELALLPAVEEARAALGRLAEQLEALRGT